MKHIVFAILAALLVGCGSLQTKQQRCDAMEEVYAAYIASTFAREVSQDEIKAAAAAAAFLSAHCGWKSVRGFEGSDPNGVPIILPP